jgi:hypothetical protein
MEFYTFLHSGALASAEHKKNARILQCGHFIYAYKTLGFDGI